MSNSCVTQPDISKITNGILKDFSVERLINFLSKLDQRVTITVEDEKQDLPSKEIVIAAKELEKVHVTT